MLINQDLCLGCRQCLLVCPMRAIGSAGDQVSINQGLCTECGVCYRAKVCPADAIVANELKWPRVIRAQFSNPLATHRNIKIEGRGTEEMKTNDITGRFGAQEIGVGIELGRPGVGSSFADFERVTKAVARYGVEFATDNPTTHLIDRATGELLPEVADIRYERVTSAIIECKVTKERFAGLYAVLQQVEPEIETVFSLDLIFRDVAAYPDFLGSMGITVRPNAKINVGMAVRRGGEKE